MPKDFDQQYSHRMLVIWVLGVTLLIAVAVLITRPNDFASGSTPATTQPPVTNPEVLRDWIPDSAYAYTVARIDDYLAANSLKVNSLTITNSVNTSSGSYDFHMITSPQTSLMNISVAISNFDSVLSTAVRINGELQTPQLTPTTIQFNGTSSLTDAGLTVGQVRATETAIQKFAPGASVVAFDTSHLSSTMDPNTGVVTYTSTASIDQKTYATKIICSDLTSVELILTDQATHQQVFDSGTVNSQS